jgi:hypothetical protein
MLYVPNLRLVVKVESYTTYQLYPPHIKLYIIKARLLRVKTPLSDTESY